MDICTSGGDILIPLKGRFRWHPEARVFAPARTEAALRQAFAGGPFRIDGTGPAAADGSIEAGDGAFETLTSGSSGQPRHIVRSVYSWTASFQVNAGMFGIGPGVRVAVLGDLVHSLALYGAIEGVHLGAEVHLLADLRPDRQRAALAARRVDVVYATPAQLRLMAEAGGAAMAARLILVGGSKLDPALRAAVAQMAPCAVVREFYGAAEASFITLSGPDCPEASVGRAYPGVEIDVRSGEIWVRSPYLFQRYGGADPGSALWRDGWLSVGEIGRMEDGFLYLSGRAGRVVTVADQNVFPEEIEAFLLTCPGVSRAAVLPRPDPLRGVHLVAVLAGAADADAVLAACRAAFGPLKAPRAVHWLQDWPALASGKTDFAAVERAMGWQ